MKFVCLVSVLLPVKLWFMRGYWLRERLCCRAFQASGLLHLLLLLGVFWSSELLERNREYASAAQAIEHYTARFQKQLNELNTRLRERELLSGNDVRSDKSSQEGALSWGESKGEHGGTKEGFAARRSDESILKWKGRGSEVLTESELGRFRNERSLRWDNWEFRDEMSLHPMSPQRVFLGPGGDARWFYVDSWHVIGPFPNPQRRNHSTHFPPELEIDLDGIYLGQDKRPVRWTFLQRRGPRIVPEIMDEYTIHYAFTELRSDRLRDVWLAFGSDDSVVVWLNGERIWSSEVHLKPWNIADGFVQAKLRTGFNQLLIRLENAMEHGAFSASIRIEE